MITVFKQDGLNLDLDAKLMYVGPVNPRSDLYIVAVEMLSDKELSVATLEKGHVIVVDPRSVILDRATGQVVYNGREHMDRMSACGE